jgi:hypothetical protein
MKEFSKKAGMTSGGKVLYPAAKSDKELPFRIQNRIRRLA